jgi:hypothetical protein
MFGFVQKVDNLSERIGLRALILFDATDLEHPDDFKCVFHIVLSIYRLGIARDFLTIYLFMTAHHTPNDCRSIKGF